MATNGNAIREEYMSSLADLDQNSKPMIDFLTMLAEDHRQHAPVVVECIKQRIGQVRQKLPLLYLIDSIVKNVGEEYKQLFQQEIVAIFVDVFDKSKNDKVREKLFALRETWKDVFLATKLYMIDVKVNQLDPNWPISKIQKKPTIHVNPNFLKKQMEPVDPIEQLKQEVLEKERKLLELKKCKLELEMRETAKKIEMEKRKRGLDADTDIDTSSTSAPAASSSKSSGKVTPVSSGLVDAVSSKSSSSSGKKSSSSSPKKSSTSPKSSSKSKSSSSSSSSRSHHSSSSSSRDKKRSSKRSSDDTSDKSPSKRNRSESESEERKAKHAAVMMKRIPKKSSGTAAASTVLPSGDTDERLAGPGQDLTAPDGGAATANQKLLLGAAAMDVDLRQFVALPADTHKGDTDDRPLMAAAAAGGKTGPATINLDDDDNAEEDSDDCNGPYPKKSKNEALDILFGSNDVDLRAMGAKANALNEKESTLGWSKLKGDTPKRGPAPKSNFEAIKSRIQEASKAKQRRFDEKIIDRQPQPMGDVDLRGAPPTPAVPTSPVLRDDTESQDALDSSIKIIMEQAQEQLDSQAITPDQYHNMVQQVIQLNETNKIKEAERMEKKTNGESRHSTSDSDSEDEMRDTRRKRKSRFQDRFPAEHPQMRMDNNHNHGGMGMRGGMAMDPRRKPWDQPPMNQMGGGMQRPPGNWRPGFNNRNPWMNGPGGGRFMGPRFNNNNRMPPFGPGGIPPPPMMPPMMPMGGPMMRPPPEPQATIKIDNVNREIRFYDDVAIVFMDWDQPKEIGFQAGTRRISCDDQWSMNLSFNAPNVTWMIDGRPHQVRLGAPTRELYIDNAWYECYIGDPCTVELDGVVRELLIDGPPPQVKIGELRREFVAGKISLIIDAKFMVPVYLDSREQQFEVDGHLQTLQFADYFLTVLINKEPMNIDFGGLPKSFYVHGQKHFMRLTPLPDDVRPGQFYVHGMTRTQLHRNVPSPPPPHQHAMMPGLPGLDAPLGSMMSHPPPSLPPTIPAALTMPPPLATGPSKLSSSLDLLTNILPGLSSPAIPLLDQPKTGGYALEQSNGATTAAAPTPSNPLGNVNVNDLFQKLLATGILGKTTPAATANPPPGEQKKSAENSKSSQKENQPKKRGRGGASGGATEKDKDDRATATAAKGSSAPILTKDKIIPVDLGNPATIKKRQLAVVQQVYLGMQCSSCGVRFPPEQTMKYSQHLDWHFRQNRRDRDSVRKAHSRKWYYDVDNWIQYEEIEDLEEREKNWFETQQSEEVGPEGEGHVHGESGALPSCPAGPTEGEKICEVCHEPFEQFYNEETEEWHLRPAVRVEEHIYHPICYEDYKLSLTLDESKMSEANAEEQDASMKQEADVKAEVKEEEKNLDQSTDNDDDVIVMPMDAPSITEILDDDEEEEAAAAGERVKSPRTHGEESNGEASQDVVVDTANIKMPMPGVVHIKSEPKDDGYRDEEEDAFEDVGTIEPIDETMEEEEAAEEPREKPVELPPSPQQETEHDNGESEVPMDTEPVPEAPVVQEDEETVFTVDTSEGGQETNPEPIALDSPMTPAVAAAAPQEHDLDRTVEMLESLEEAVMPVVTIVPNKIKINISKLASSSLQAEGNTDSRDSVQSGGGGHAEEQSRSRAPTPEPEMSYEVKESMRDVEFMQMGTVASGIETSGLCSIM